MRFWVVRFKVERFRGLGFEGGYRAYVGGMGSYVLSFVVCGMIFSCPLPSCL